MSVKYRRKKIKLLTQMSKEANSLVTPHSWVIDPFLQCSLEMGEALRAASEPHLLAEVIPPSPADSALRARHANLQSHAVADGEAIHLRSDGDHDP